MRAAPMSSPKRPSEGPRLRGVNLGGWLLVERWMSPAIFGDSPAQDEFGLVETEAGRDSLRRHRDTFITEDDFRWIRDHGLNAVRLPIGYWALVEDGPFLSAREHLDWAVRMCERYGLQLIIDLHAIGSLRGGTNIPRRIGTSSYRGNPYDFDAALGIVTALAERYKDSPAFWGLSLMNEPKVGLFQPRLRRYYRRAISELTQILSPRTRIIISDAFTLRLFSRFRRDLGDRLVIDTHIYHMTALFWRFYSLESYTHKVRRDGKRLARYSRWHPVIIGEWSGVHRGELMSRVPHEAQDDIFVRYVREQLHAYMGSAGWFYWSYKTQDPGVWNFRSEVEIGHIDPADFSGPSQR